MISQLIENYHKQKKAIELAVSSGDYKSVYAIDAEFQITWNQILEYEPADQNEKQALAKFLIDFILQAGQMGTTKQNVMAKLVALSFNDNVSSWSIGEPS